MSLLRDIQLDATGDTVALPVLLRKCMILAKRLQHRPMALWVDHELNDYNKVEDLPPYRVFARAQVLGNFIGPFWAQFQKLPIPTMAVEEAHRDMLFNAYLMYGVAHYEAALADTPDQEWELPWPADFLVYYSTRVGPNNYTCTKAWRIITRGMLQGMLDQIRNRVLSFALEIEAENPEAGEATLQGSPPIPEAKMQQIFNTNIYGGTNVVSSGSQSQISDFEQNVATWDGLAAALRQIGLKEPDITDLADAIQADVTSPSKPGPAVTGWVDSITAKITSGAINVTNSAAGALITSLILQHFASATQ